MCIAAAAFWGIFRKNVPTVPKGSYAPEYEQFLLLKRCFPLLSLSKLLYDDIFHSLSKDDVMSYAADVLCVGKG